jgi:putative endonuclease
LNEVSLPAKAKNYYVYVLSCEDGTFYTGYTTSLERRIRLHKKGRGARYTHAHGAVKVIHREVFATRSEAMRRERQIKRLTHEQKARLFRGNQ